MTKIDITRTELVWPGKYGDDGNLTQPRRVNLPFQVIERVNETRATREQQEQQRAGHIATLFDYWQADEKQMAGDGDGWRNKLIWGDNLYIISSLLEHFAGKIDLIYIDPPFATGADFTFVTKVGDRDIEASKEQSILEEKAYRDTWGRGFQSYLCMLKDRLEIMNDLLSERGSIYVHVDWHVGHYVKLIMDDICGRSNFQNEIIWAYRSQGATKRRWSRKHDTIFFYAKSDEWTFNVQRERSYMLHKYGFNKDDFKIDEEGRQYRDAIVRDIWEIPAIQSATRENLGFRTQKPEKLLERILQASTNEGSLVADFFCGSGTTLAVAEKLGRRWIDCDLSRYAIHVTRKRLMEIPECRPFEILNLGKYERQVWQGVTFGGEKRPQQMLIFEYLKFILDLYGAQPLAGTQHVHG